MKILKGFTSTLSALTFFLTGNILFYFFFFFFPNWAILHVIVAAFMNFAIGVMITYNALVANNKRNVEKMLTPTQTYVE